MDTSPTCMSYVLPNSIIPWRGCLNSIDSVERINSTFLDVPIGIINLVLASRSSSYYYTLLSYSFPVICSFLWLEKQTETSLNSEGCVSSYPELLYLAEKLVSGRVRNSQGLCTIEGLYLVISRTNWFSVPSAVADLFQLMGRPFLKCLRRESQLCLLTEDASAFCSSLAEDIEMLEMSLAKGSISLKWCFEAMSLLKRMQQDLLGLLKKSKLPVDYGAEEDWLDQYMKESATLLDFCNSLKIAISGINRYRMVVDITMQMMSQQSSSSMVIIQKHEKECSEKVHAKSLDVCLGPERLKFSNGCFLGCNGRDEKSMAAVLLAARGTMIALSLLLVSAMSCPISIDMATEMFSSECPELNQCVQNLAALVDTFCKQISSHDKDCKAVLAEHEMVETVLGNLKAQVVEGVKEKSEKFLCGLEKLRTRSCELREGVDRFDAMVDEVFKEVIRGRDDMLVNLRKEALNMI